MLGNVNVFEKFHYVINDCMLVFKLRIVSLREISNKTKQYYYKHCQS